MTWPWHLMMMMMITILDFGRASCTVQYPTNHPTTPFGARRHCPTALLQRYRNGVTNTVQTGVALRQVASTTRVKPRCQTTRDFGVRVNRDATVLCSTVCHDR